MIAQYEALEQELLSVCRIVDDEDAADDHIYRHAEQRFFELVADLSELKDKLPEEYCRTRNGHSRQGPTGGSGGSS